MVFLYLVISRSGCLLFKKEFTAFSLTENDFLVIAGIVQSCCLIPQRCCAAFSKGVLRSIVAEERTIQIHETAGGVKHVLVTMKNGTVGGGVFESLVKLYIDYVLKDPFVNVEMPVRSSLYESRVVEVLSRKKGVFK